MTEAAMSFAATQTTGSVQLLFTAFAIFLAICVVALFFITLWYRPWVLYHPGEYGRQDVGRYVEAMNIRGRDEISLDQSIQRSLRTIFVEDFVPALERLPIDAHTRETLRGRLDHAADQAVADIRNSSFLSFDFREILGEESPPWVVPYERFGSVSAMLDDVWINLMEQMPARTYGHSWILKSVSSNEIFDEMGRRYAYLAFGTSTDRRSLSEVGIRPGMHLSTIPLSSGA
ncbi:MAG: hypothetical protein WBR13_02355 [Allosphingosinicella sp.]